MIFDHQDPGDGPMEGLTITADSKGDVERVCV